MTARHVDSMQQRCGGPVSIISTAPSFRFLFFNACLVGKVRFISQTSLGIKALGSSTELCDCVFHCELPAGNAGDVSSRRRRFAVRRLQGLCRFMLPQLKAPKNLGPWCFCEVMWKFGDRKYGCLEFQNVVHACHDALVFCIVLLN